MARAENKEVAGSTTRYVAHIARKMRERQNLSQKEVGDRTGFSAAAISAMETCAQPASDQMLVKLEEVIGGGLELFESARPFVLMEKYPARFRHFSRMEAEACTIYAYETSVIDGLFQTEDYARALISGGFPILTEGKVEQLVDARMSRKALFDREPVALIELILDESVLRRPFGDWQTHREQLQCLSEDARRRNVTIQVMPLERGLRGTYAGDRGPMKLVETQDHDHVVYMEIEDESILVSDPPKVSRLSHRYAKIRSEALSPAESLGLIERLAGEER